MASPRLVQAGGCFFFCFSCFGTLTMNAETRRRVDDLISRLRFLRDSL